MIIWTLNAGSSSVKLAIFEPSATSNSAPRCVLRRRVTLLPAGEAATLAQLRTEHAAHAPNVIAHRVVHGGHSLSKPCVIDPAARRAIEAAASFAPLHNPVALRWIDACQSVWGNKLRQIAVFDTAFFAQLPETAWRYALPTALADKHHLRRYGFHGIAHANMYKQFSALRPDLERGGRLVTLQLGGGCSAAAILNGTPQDTSMGFSPLEGLVMATRAGDIDAGLLVHLQRALGYDAAAVESLLLRESGLLGLSGTSSSAGDLLTADTPAARRALDIYCRRVAKYIAAYASVLGGLDVIGFGGGVGENVPAVRKSILERLAFLGVQVDDARNLAGGKISSDSSSIDCRVLAVDEESELAAAAQSLGGGA